MIDVQTVNDIFEIATTRGDETVAMWNNARLMGAHLLEDALWPRARPRREAAELGYPAR